MCEKKSNFAEQIGQDNENETRQGATKTKTRTMQTILIVDDEQDIREILAFNLEQAGYICLQAANGQRALAILAEQKADLILLDVMMPGKSGFEVAQQIADTPIIFLTALGEEDDLLRGFALGADDYITKPFSIKEVLVRIKRSLERTHSVTPLPSAGGLCFDNRTFTASIDGEDIGLTKMEYELLHFLVQHPEAVYSRSELLSEVWPNNGLVLERTVDVTITRLRKKIGEYKDQLKTKTGYGYYWE